MANLPWFPTFANEWLSSPAISMMLPEQEGAFIRLLCLSWGKGDVEPSLPSDAATLAQMSRLGARWKKLGPLILDQFEVRNGRLVHAKLVTTWWQQQEKHAVTVRKASAGGKAKAAKQRASGSAPSTPQAVLELCSESAEERELLPGPNGPRVEATEQKEPAAIALAPEGARSAAAPNGKDYRDTTQFREAALRRGVRVPDELPPVPTLGENALDAQSAADAYTAWLIEQTDPWLASNADEAAEIEREQRADMFIKAGDRLSDRTQERLRMAIRLAAGKRLKLASQAQWIAARNGSRSHAGAAS